MEILLYIGIVQTIFAMLLMLTKKRIQISDIVLAVWLFLISIQFFTSLLSITNEKYLYSGLILSKLISFTYGPFIFIYAKMLILEKPVFRIRYWFHFIPFVLAIIVFFIVPGETVSKEEIRKSFMGGEILPIHKVYSILIMLSIMIYSISIVHLLKKHERKVYNYFSYDSQKTNLRWLKTIVLIFALTYLMAIVVRLSNLVLNLHNPIFQPAIFPVLGLTIFAYTISFFGFNQEAVFVNESFIRLMKRKERLKAANENDKKVSHKYERSGLKEEDANRYLAAVLQYMETEKPYIDGNFTIDNLSKLLNIPRYYLTQVINEKLQKNFYTFINEYRVEEVKRRIIDDENQNYTLLAVAFDSGFNSKSSFNTIFKKFTGYTPSQYKKKNLGTKSED